MKSSKRIAEEIAKAQEKHTRAYRDMLRLAARMKKLDQIIRRLKKARRHARSFERNPHNRFPSAAAQAKAPMCQTQD